MKKTERKILNNQGGFTLIEIIAVLVILGILAAVAVPKYLDLTTDAKKKSIAGAIAAARSNLSLSYSKYLLEKSKAPKDFKSSTDFGTADADWGGTATKVEGNLGDFKAKYSKKATTGTTITITIEIEDPDKTGSVDANGTSTMDFEISS